MSATSTFLSVGLLSLFMMINPFSAFFTFTMSSPSAPKAGIVFFGIVTILFAAIGARLLIASVSHYRASKGMILSISAGNPFFQFGPLDAPVTYDKKDIREVILYGNSKGFEGLKRTEIIFRDGRSINISGMIAHLDTMSRKFPGQKVTRKTPAFAFIPRASSIPS
jgi:hypothetical protein